MQSGLLVSLNRLSVCSDTLVQRQ